MNEKNTRFIDSIHNLFSLRHDMASYEEIENTIASGARLQGTNLCILMLAILIASVGLNMNSTAVIIGAMLISPLMGAITAIAYGIATNDLRLAKFSAFKLIVQVIISIGTSAIYFAISPINTASSELIARTKPTAWDVIIAICGGLAGIIGQTRKEKSNVIPGVAIATALMPPLCTAGYGLAHFQWSYFGGALYLFFINGFFICVSSIIVLKYLKVPTNQELSPKALNKIHRIMVIIAIITMIPSIYMAYGIVADSIENSNADSFIQNEFDFDGTQIVDSKIDIDTNTIAVSLIGKGIDDSQISGLKDRLSSYSLKGYKLDISQTKVEHGVSASEVEEMLKDKDKGAIEEEKVAEVILQKENEDLKEQNSQLQKQIDEYNDKQIDVGQICGEISAINPKVKGIIGGNTDVYISDGSTDKSAAYITLLVSKTLTSSEMNTLKNWLEKRLDNDGLLVIQKNVKDVPGLS